MAIYKYTKVVTFNLEMEYRAFWCIACTKIQMNWAKLTENVVKFRREFRIQIIVKNQLAVRLNTGLNAKSMFLNNKT